MGGSSRSMCDWEAMACVGVSLLFIPCDPSDFALFGFPLTACVGILLVEGK